MLVALIDLPRFPESGWTVLPEVVPSVDAVLLRGKSLSPIALYEVGTRLRQTAPPVALWVSDRLDVALALGSAGLHLPADGLGPTRIRPFWSGTLSAAVHDGQEASKQLGADLWIWGHAFPTRSKPGAPARSRLALQEVLALATCPVLAIGGIGVDNVSQLAGLGLRGVVVQDGIWLAPNPAAAALKLKQAVSDPRWQGGGEGCN